MSITIEMLSTRPVANAHDQVGRHLQGHLYGGAIGIFDEVVNDLVGPGPSISTHDFRHGNDGLVGGGMIANEFVPTPVSTFGYLRQAGLIGPHGLAAKQGLRRLLPRMQRVVGPVQEVTSADSRVRLDPSVTDSLGIPVARLSGRLHPNDLAAATAGRRGGGAVEGQASSRSVTAGLPGRSAGIEDDIFDRFARPQDSADEAARAPPAVHADRRTLRASADWRAWGARGSPGRGRCDQRQRPGCTIPRRRRGEHHSLVEAEAIPITLSWKGS